MKELKTPVKPIIYVPIQVSGIVGFFYYAYDGSISFWWFIALFCIGTFLGSKLTIESD